MNLAIGIDIGGSSVKAALLRDGLIASTGTSDRYEHPSASTVSAAVQQAIAQLHGPATCPIGLCLPGLLTADRKSIERSINLPALQGVPLHSLLGVPPTVVTSDAVAAAADLQLGRGLGGRLFALALGTGVGAAVLDDGLPLRISGDGPGHFGQLDVSGGDPAAPVGPDGGRGSLEAYCGAAAWPTLINESSCAMQLRALAQAIRIAHAIYRPAHVAILGGTALRTAVLKEALRAAVTTSLTSMARPGCTLNWAEHAHHSAAGAARLALRA